MHSLLFLALALLAVVNAATASGPVELRDMSGTLVAVALLSGNGYVVNDRSARQIGRLAPSGPDAWVVHLRGVGRIQAMRQGSGWRLSNGASVSREGDALRVRHADGRTERLQGDPLPALAVAAQ